MSVAVLSRRPGIPRAGLLALYRFEDGAGQTLGDTGGNGYNAVLGSTSGADTNDPIWVVGGLSYDGVDDSVSAANLPALTGPHTILVVHTPRSGNGGYPAVFLQDDGTNSNRASHIYWDRANPGYAAQRSVGGSYYTAQRTTAPAGVPHWIVMTYNGATLSIQSDNGPVVTASAPASTTPPSRTIIGGNAMLGTLHYLAVYGQVLSAAEITRAYRAVKLRLAARQVTI